VLSHCWRSSGQHHQAINETANNLKAKGLSKAQTLISLSNQSTMKNQLDTNMNLPQTQREAKQAYLDKQQEQMLYRYEKAASDERNAIIKHVDSFLSTCNQDQKTFWLKFRRKLEKLNESTILFPLGNVYMTPGAQEALEESNELPINFLKMHQTGNWGIVGKEDWQENDFSVKNGYRILSAYKTAQGVKLWLITEADRSATTILLPEDY
jgi:hypothetical protein